MTSPVQKLYSIFRKAPRTPTAAAPPTVVDSAQNRNTNAPSGKRKTCESNTSSPVSPPSKVVMLDNIDSFLPARLTSDEINSYLINSHLLTALNLEVRSSTSNHDRLVSSLKNTISEQSNEIAKLTSLMSSAVSSLKITISEQSNEIARLTSLLASADKRDLERLKHSKDNPLKPINLAGVSEAHPIHIDKDDDGDINVPNVPVHNRFEVLSKSPEISLDNCAKPDNGSNTNHSKASIDQLNCAIVGTSLVKYVSNHLPSDISDKVNVYSYRGKKLNFIRHQIKNTVVDRNLVLVLGGGNDAQHHPVHLVVKECSFLINEIKRLNPYAHIVLCSLPPRTDNPEILNAIGQINRYIRSRVGQYNKRRLCGIPCAY